MSDSPIIEEEKILNNEWLTMLLYNSKNDRSYIIYVYSLIYNDYSININDIYIYFEYYKFWWYSWMNKSKGLIMIVYYL